MIMVYQGENLVSALARQTAGQVSVHILIVCHHSMCIVILNSIDLMTEFEWSSGLNLFYLSCYIDNERVFVQKPCHRL